jgi:CRP-like cAMP-binding protein
VISIELFRHEDKYETFPAGATIFKDGEEGHSMYVVCEGTVKLMVHGRLLEKVTARGIFGELALIDDAPRSATAIAETDVKLAEITEKRFDFLVSQTPKFALQIMRIMADRLRHDADKLRKP